MNLITKKPFEMKTLKKFSPKILTSLSVVAFLLLAIAAVSCKGDPGEKKDDVTREDVEDKIEEAASTTRAYLSEERKKLINEFEAQISQAEEQIEVLKEKMEDATGQVKERYQKTINSLERQKADAQKQLNQLKESTEDAWDEVEKGVNKALSDLDKALEKAKDEF